MPKMKMSCVMPVLVIVLSFGAGLDAFCIILLSSPVYTTTPSTQAVLRI